MGEAPVAYRCFDYVFALECGDPDMRHRVERLLAPWAAASVPDVPVYSLVATSTSTGLWYQLWLGGDELAVGPDAGDVVDQLLFAVSTAAFDAASGLLLIHAGAVVSDDGIAVADRERGRARW